MPDMYMLYVMSDPAGDAVNLLTQALEGVPADTRFSTFLSLSRETGRRRGRRKKKNEPEEPEEPEEKPGITFYSYRYRLQATAKLRAEWLVSFETKRDVDTAEYVYPDILKWLESTAKETERAGEDVIVMSAGNWLADRSFLNAVLTASWHLSILYYPKNETRETDVYAGLVEEFHPLILEEGDLPSPLDVIRAHSNVSRIRQNAGSPPSKIEVDHQRRALRDAYLNIPELATWAVEVALKHIDEAQAKGEEPPGWAVQFIQDFAVRWGPEIEKLKAERAGGEPSESKEPPVGPPPDTIRP